MRSKKVEAAQAPETRPASTAKSMPVALCLQIFGEATPDLVEQEPDERFGPVDVGWRDDEVERRRMLAADDVGDAPVAARVTAATTGSR